VVLTALSTSSVQAAGAPTALGDPTVNRAMPLFASNTGTCTYGQGGGMTRQSPCYPAGALQYNSSRNCTDLLLNAVAALFGWFYDVRAP
jgi:hypothetical protein